MSFTKAVENRLNRLKLQRQQGRISEEEFLREVERLQFEDEHGRLWMIDASSGNWYFEENGQWVSDVPPDFEPAIRCSRCGKPVEEIGASMCTRCQAEIAAALAQARAGHHDPEVMDTSQGQEEMLNSPQPDQKATEPEEGQPAQDGGWIPGSGDQRAQFFYEHGVEYFDARNWQKALDFFEQALRLEPGYRDAQKLARVARERLASEKDQRALQSKLTTLYERAEQHMIAAQWQEAYDLLLEVQALDPSFREVQLLSEKAANELGAFDERRRQLSAFEALYERAEASFRQKRWSESVTLLMPIRDLNAKYLAGDPRYIVASDMLAEAQRQAQLETLYTEAAQQLQDGRLARAAQLLRDVCAIDSDYRDTRTLLDETEKRIVVERMYAEGLECLNGERWTEAVSTFESVSKLAPDYKMTSAGLLYAQAMQAAKAGDWASAVDALNGLVLQDASYRDAAAQLASYKARLRLQNIYDEGVRHAEAGQWQDAVRAFETAASLSPDYQDVTARLVEARSELELSDLYTKGVRFADGNRLPEAIAVCEQILARRSDYRDVAQRLTTLQRLQRISELYAEGVSAFQRGQWSDAIIDLKRVVEIDSSYRDAAQRLKEAQRQERLSDLYTRGSECLQAKDWARAIDYFGQVTGEDPVYRDATTRLMEARRQRQLIDLYREGEAGFAEGRWQDAMSAFEKMLSLDPNDEWGVSARMRESRRQRDLAELYAQALMLFEQQRWEEATRLFENLLEQEPNYRDSSTRLEELDRHGQMTALQEKASQYRAAGQWEAAIDTYERMLRIDASFEFAIVGLAEVRECKQCADMFCEGQSLMEQQRWARAIEVFERLLLLEPAREEVIAALGEARRQQNLAELYAQAERDLQQGHTREAVDRLEKVVSISPEYRDAQSRLEQARSEHRVAQLLDKGKALSEQGDPEAAVKLLRQALEIQPENRAAREALQSAEAQLEIGQYYDAGLRYFDNQEWPEAIDFLGRVTHRKPDYRDAAARLQVASKQQELGRLYAVAQDNLRAEHWAEAAALLRQVVAIEPQYKDAARQLGQADARIRSAQKALYDKGRDHLAAGRWLAAIDVFEQLRSEKADFQDLDRLLQEARAWQEQTQVAALYEQGMTYLLNNDLEQAAACFERVKAQSPGFKDVEEQLKRVRQRRLKAYVAEPERAAPQEHNGIPVTAVAITAIGIVFCCLAALGLVVIASQSSPLTAYLAAQFPGPTVPVPISATVSLGDSFQAAPESTRALVAPAMISAPTSTLAVTTTVLAPTVTPQADSLRLPDTATPSLTQGTVSTAAVRTSVPELAPTTAIVQRSIPQLQPGIKRPVRVPPAVQGRFTAVSEARQVVTPTAKTPAARPQANVEPKQTEPPPLSGKIAFSVYEPGPRRYGTYIASVDGTGMTGLLSDAGAPALSPDGAELAYRSWTNSDRRIMALDLKTGQSRKLTGFAEDGRPDWASDGRLTFDSTRESDRRSRIYVGGTWQGAADASLAGSTGAIQGDSPSWLGAGRIAYNACLSGGCGIYVISADGSGATKIVDNPDRVSLEGSPDGSRIAYASRQDGHWDIFVIGSDGGGGQRLTNDDASDWLPTWSPDGSHIAFVSNRDGQWAIWAMTASGGNVRKLFDLPGSPDGVVRDEPAWSSMGWMGERISWAP